MFAGGFVGMGASFRSSGPTCRPWYAAPRELSFGTGADLADDEAVPIVIARLLPLIAFHAGVYAAVLGLLGYRASLSSLNGQLGFYRDAFIASTAAIALTLLAARARRAGPLFPFAAIVATLLPIALLAAWVGLDPKVVPPPTAGVLLLIGSPLILSACLVAALWSALPPPRLVNDRRRPAKPRAQ